jgi:protein-disulfide isomerase
MTLRPLSIAVISASLLLSACGVDTTGLSADSSRSINPQTSANAAVTVTEYGDLQCPACGSAYPLIVKPIIEKYGQKIAFEFKHFPLQTLHQYALLEAQAAECAADQGKFWEFVDLAYTKQSELNRDAPAAWAKSLGLDMTLFGRCVDSGIKKKTVLADYTEGKDGGVQGTPTFFVNGKHVESDVAAIGAAIDAALATPTQQL